MGGAARRERLLAAGLSRHALSAALAAGHVTSPFRGVYCLPRTDMGVVQAARFRARLSCVSAFASWDVPLLAADARLHVAADGGAARTIGGTHVRVHQAWRHGRDRIAAAHGSRVGEGVTVSPTQALAHAARCLSPHSHLVVADAMLNRGLMSQEDVATLPRSVASRRDWLLGHMDGRAESAGETIARIELVEAGLRCWPQARIESVGRVDLLVAGKVVIEVDGHSYHSDQRAFQSDRDRDRRLTEQGFRVLRFTHGQVVAGGAVVEPARRALAMPLDA